MEQDFSRIRVWKEMVFTSDGNGMAKTNRIAAEALSPVRPNRSVSRPGIRQWGSLISTEGCATADSVARCSHVETAQAKITISQPSQRGGAGHWRALERNTPKEDPNARSITAVALV